MEIGEEMLDDFLADFDIDGDGGEHKVAQTENGWTVLYKKHCSSWGDAIYGYEFSTQDEAQARLEEIEREMKIRSAIASEDVYFYFRREDAEVALRDLADEY
jgi:hypothetical protein